ncbi:MAG: ABC transporter permease [Pseudomonadota bacterium]|jgi:peptide/nickel transport system permease protein|nr:ABC transporter permease [Pseudomonadota bacterium]
MVKFLLHRLYISILVAITVSVISFSLLRLSGDLAAELAGEDATEKEIALIAHQYGLDRPLYIQYFDWAGNAITGDLGRSLFTNEPVSEMILERLGVTVKLAIYSIVLGLLMAIPIGVLAAIRPNTWVDRFALGLAVFGQAIPNFFFALLMIILFGVQLRWLPISGNASFAHFIMPTLTLGTSVMPQFMRLTRTGMLDVLDSDFIRTARAKGLHPMRVLFKHALRNAILPIVSLMAVVLGFLLGGTVIIESIFALNGVGFLAFESIMRQDFPVVQSIVFLASIAYIFLTLCSDLINAQLDPRIRLG